MAAVYKIMRPGEPPTEESSEKLSMIFLWLELVFRDELQFYSKIKRGEVITLNKDIIEQEGVWLLKEKEVSFTVVTCKKSSVANFG